MAKDYHPRINALLQHYPGLDSCVPAANDFLVEVGNSFTEYDSVINEQNIANTLAKDELTQVKYRIKNLEDVWTGDLFGLFEHSSIAVAITHHAKILHVNNRYCEMIGYSREELLQMTIGDVTHKEDVGVSIGNTDKLEDKKIASFSMIKRYQRKDGNTYWCNTHVTPVLDANGDITYHFAIIQDYQEKKMAEEKQIVLLNELRRSNEELETFAQIVSHDLKSPLKGVGILLDWLTKDHISNLDTDGIDLIQQIDDRITKLNQLIDGIMDYTKAGEEMENEVFEMREVINQVLQLIYKPKHVQISVEGEFPRILANKHKIHQLFQNLIDNAIKFGSDSDAKVSIKGSKDKNFYIFRISDNGKGVPEKYRDKIFKIFSTLGKGSTGTGIGLSIVKKIVSDYEGTVYVDSKVDVGSTFSFTLLKSKVEIDEG